MHSIPSFPCVIINIIYNVPVLVLKMSSKQRLVLNAKSDIWHDKPGKNNKWSSYLNSHMRNSLYIKKINIFYHYINTLQHFTEIFSHHSQHVMWCNMCVCVCVYASMHVYVHVTACLLACVCMRQWQMQQSTPIQIPRDLLLNGSTHCLMAPAAPSQGALCRARRGTACPDEAAALPPRLTPAPPAELEPLQALSWCGSTSPLQVTVAAGLKTSHVNINTSNILSRGLNLHPSDCSVRSENITRWWHQHKQQVIKGVNSAAGDCSSSLKTSPTAVPQA